jgi:iron(III) transport system substrate-binding protein
MRYRRDQQLLPGTPDALGQARRTRPSPTRWRGVPNQDSYGTHLNIAGGAVAKHAKNKDNAVKFLEYLASPAAQNYFANGNNEWPTAKGVTVDNPALKAMTQGKPFKSETIPISAVGANMVKVQQMLDRVGFQ